MELDLAGNRIKGGRDYQEDTFAADLIDPANLDPPRPGAISPVLLLLADGMGGEGGGDIASDAVVGVFKSRFKHSRGPCAERLKEALDASNAYLAKMKSDKPELPEFMGCTLIGAVITNEGLEWISVGDSPLYLYRDGAVTQINEDHSVGAEAKAQLRAGEITRQEYEAIPGKNALISAITGADIDIFDLTKRGLPLRRGDVVVIASDGIETLAESTIARVITGTAANGAKEVVQGLIRAVVTAGRPDQDNTTVIAVCIPDDLGGQRTVFDVGRARFGDQIDSHDWRVLLAVVVGIFLIGVIAGLLFFSGASSPDIKLNLDQSGGPAASGEGAKQPPSGNR